MKNSNTKPKNVSYAQVPGKLWKKIKKHFPKQPVGGKGRPACPNRAVLDGIWYVMWSGCQWKSIERHWFGVCSSVLHARFQKWQRQDIFIKVVEAMLRYYGRTRHIRWTWQSADSRSVSAPYRGTHTGPNPTDRAKAGGKIHLLVDQRGAPLAVDVFGANHNE